MSRKIKMKIVKYKREYKVGQVFFCPNGRHSVEKYTVVAIKPTYDFKGEYDTDNYQRHDRWRVYLAALDGSNAPVRNFVQGDIDVEKIYYKDSREAYKYQVTENLRKAQEDYDWVMKHIVNKEDMKDRTLGNSSPKKKKGG